MAVTATFQFGSVVLDCTQSSHQNETVWDEGGVNVTGVRRRITTRGVLASGLRPTISGESPSDTFARLKDYLMRNRRYFLWAPVGGQIITVGDPANPDDPTKNLDADNGPKVTSVREVGLTEASIFVEVTIEVFDTGCAANASKSILNHHFRATEIYDPNGWRTRTIQGTIRCRVRMAKQDAISQAGIPAVPPGFQEDEFSNGWDADGLTLRYARTEIEYTTRPPDWGAGSTVRTRFFNKANNAANYGTTVVYMTRNRDEPKSVTFGRANQVAIGVAFSFARETEDGILPIVDVSAEWGDGAKGEADAVTVTVSYLTDVKKTSNAEGGFRSDLTSVPPPGFLPQGSAPYLIPRDPKAELDLQTPPLQEPCGPFVKSPGPTKLFGTLQAGGAFGLAAQTGGPAGAGGQQQIIGGTLESGPGPAAGGGGPGGGPQGLTPQDIAKLLGGLIPVGPVGAGGAAESSFGVAIPFAELNTFQAQDALLRAQLLASSEGELAGGAGYARAGGGAGSTRAGEPHADPVDATNVYSIFMVHSELDVDRGKKALPGAGPRKPDGTRYPNPVVSMHNGKAKAKFKWTAGRFGVPPQVPDPVPPDGSNFLLTRDWYRKDEPYKLPSGHLFFLYTGCYEYDVLNLDELVLPDPIPPFLLPQVKAQFPSGLPQATVAKDIIWWGINKLTNQKAANDLLQANFPATDFIFLNGVQFPTS